MALAALASVLAYLAASWGVLLAVRPFVRRAASANEEWDRVQETWAWRKGIAEQMTENTWPMVRDAVQEANVGVECPA